MTLSNETPRYICKCIRSVNIKIETLLFNLHDVMKTVIANTGLIQESLSKIQGLFKDFLRLSYSFQGLKVYEKSWFKC